MSQRQQVVGARLQGSTPQHRPALYVIAAVVYFAVKWTTFSIAGAAWGLYLGIALGALAATTPFLVGRWWARR
ncbi:MAG TPA: hypothetical protein PKE56_17385 [Acidimicrobiales bacterium]|nr:hypothetical protein [Acidimicrobiales bacterium]